MPKAVSVTIWVGADVVEEIDRQASKYRQQFPKDTWKRDTTAAALLTAWAHAQQRKRQPPKGE